MTYALKMARAAAPAIDRAARRLHDGGHPRVMDRMTVQYQATQLTATFASPADMVIGGGVLAEEFRADGWSWSAVYDNGDAVTGSQIGVQLTHPGLATRRGGEARGRPSKWRVEGPMPGPIVHLDADAIERMAQEAAEVVRDMLRQQSLRENGRLPKGTYDFPAVADNPLETVFHRDAAEWNDEPVQAPQPVPLNEVFSPETRDPEGD